MTRVGIASQKEIRERILAIAKGDLRPGVNAPKIWFTSIDSLCKTLSNQNSALLNLIKSR